MTKPSEQLPKCLNCDELIKGNFCHHCGQSTTIQRITFKDTIVDFFSSLLALEAPLLRTIRGLLLHPGQLLRAFINGKRKSHYKPVAFFIVLSAIYLIIRSLINYDPFAGQQNLQNPDVPEEALKFIEASRFMVANINNIMFFLVLSIGLVGKALFYKQYNLAEYVTVGFFISGIYNLFGILHMLFSVFVAFVNPQINLVFLSLLLFYVIASLLQGRRITDVVKYVFFSLFSIILYVAMGYGFSFLIVSMR